MYFVPLQSIMFVCSYLSQVQCAFGTPLQLKQHKNTSGHYAILNGLQLVYKQNCWALSIVWWLQVSCISFIGQLLTIPPPIVHVLFYHITILIVCSWFPHLYILLVERLSRASFPLMPNVVLHFPSANAPYPSPSSRHNTPFSHVLLFGEQCPHMLNKDDQQCQSCNPYIFAFAPAQLCWSMLWFLSSCTQLWTHL